MKYFWNRKNSRSRDRAEFEGAVHLTRGLLDEVRAGRMSSTELAIWLQQLMMRRDDPLSDNEKSAIVCTLVVTLLQDGGGEIDASQLLDLVTASDQALAIGRLV
jgi:hypothetical protein